MVETESLNALVGQVTRVRIYVVILFENVFSLLILFSFKSKAIEVENHIFIA